MPNPRRTSRARPKHAPQRAWWLANRGWLLGAVAYGLSWPLSAFNLSWLAWGAFVPLFHALAAPMSLRRHAALSAGFLAVAMSINCAGGLYGVPGWYKAFAIANGLTQGALQVVPLLLLFPLRQRLGWAQALLVLIPLWPFWEWASHLLPISTNTLPLSTSQSVNVWLVQYVDLFGAWAVSAWVIAINVVLYRAFLEARERISVTLLRHALPGVALLLLLPLGYAGVRLFQIAPPSDALDVTLVSTNVSPIPNRSADHDRNLERIVHLTDSVAHAHHTPPDVYVWHEGVLTPRWEQPQVRDFLFTAIGDWEAPLLTGATVQQGIQDALPTSTAGGLVDSAIDSTAEDSFAVSGHRYNQALLLHAETAQVPEIQAYTKVKLIPIHEGLPAHNLLHRFQRVREWASARQLYTPGVSPTLLAVPYADGLSAQIGSPICHEANFPEHWARLSRLGAETFVQLSFESWFGSLGFQRVLAGATRYRAIETRRSVARNANGGPSQFIDAFGVVHREAPRPESTARARLSLRSGQTLYVKMPWLFPLLCGLICLVMLGTFRSGAMAFPNSRATH